MELTKLGRSAGAAIVVGLLIVGVGMLIVRDGAVSDAEESVFRFVNDLPGWLYVVFGPLQLVGALLLGPIVAAGALVLRRYRLAVAALVVTLLKLLSERGVKALVSRERPGTSIGPDIETRGDVPLTGESFVSGHAVLVTGIATVVSPYVPGRWKIVPWGVAAAVCIGRVYVGAHNPLDVVCGAALGVAIGAAANLLTAPRRRPQHDGGAREVAPPDVAVPQPGRQPSPGSNRTRLATAVTVVAAGALTVAGCGGDATDTTPATALADDAITVGSFDFAESAAVAEVYARGLEAEGFRVVRAFSLGPREFVAPALAAGLVELVPEYAGTAAEFHSLGAAEPTDDVVATHDALVRAVASLPVTVLAAAPAQDANTFVVTQATAERLGIRSLSDLAAVDDLALGGPAECASRRYCLPGLTDVYGTRFAEFVALDAGGELTRQALLHGGVDVALMFTTDPAIEELDLVELADDRGLQPAENLTPIVRTEVVERWGDRVRAAVDDVSARLTTARVRALNGAVAAADGDIAAAVASWSAEETS
ncbi:MAG TPA: glycine betaine ABC transporter substrate-binding protein [Ilumatobacteraceae bacterium]|nr:glycine betaine ABC transporter substrate-binding protein [Ilumatobacteraceae bacterium]